MSCVLSDLSFIGRDTSARESEICYWLLCGSAVVIVTIVVKVVNCVLFTLVGLLFDMFTSVAVERLVKIQVFVMTS